MSESTRLADTLVGVALGAVLVIGCDDGPLGPTPMTTFEEASAASQHVNERTFVSSAAWRLPLNMPNAWTDVDWMHGSPEGDVVLEANLCKHPRVGRVWTTDRAITVTQDGSDLGVCP